MSAFARDLAALDRAVRRLAGNPSSAPSSRALGRWYDQQPDGDYTCADCGRVGPKHYIQPQHPFYTEGREDIARCGDCLNRRNAESRARAKAERAQARAGRIAEVHPSGAYSDGRTIPQLGDEVYTYIPAMFGSAAVLSGTVVRQRDGSIGVRAQEASSLLGGRERLARARTYPLGTAWTRRGEKHPNDVAMDRAQDEEHERAVQRAREAVSLRERIASSKASGARHLDEHPDVPVGTRIRSLRAGVPSATVTGHDAKYGPLVAFEGEPDYMQRTLGGKVSDFGEWVVLR